MSPRRSWILARHELRILGLWCAATAAVGLWAVGRSLAEERVA